MYNFNENVSRLNTNAVQTEMIPLIYQRRDLMPFWIADMDIKVPERITSAISERLNHGIFGYTSWKHDNFYGPIRHWYSTRFETNILKQDISYAPSVLFTVTEAIRILTSEGDGVILNTPSYNNFINLIQGNKRMIVENELFFDGYEYTMDFVQFEYLCQMPQNKVFLLCNPHNPTGKVFSEQELQKIIEICKKNDVYIIADEIHMDFVRRGKHVTLARFMKDFDQMLVTTCLGKTFNVSGIPHAYFITKDKFMMEAINTKVMAVYGLSAVNLVALTIIKTAYLECADWVDALNQHIDNNMLIVEEYIADYLSDCLFFQKPDATFLAWINFEKSGFSEIEVQNALQNVGKIATGIGNTYELSASTHFRFNVACSEGKLLEGLERIKKSFDYLKEKAKEEQH
ncbi:MalY/PatB family protein [Macrococcus animalis]|uniref:MalY/PatB family protein n=1 Tax=Macrococcus animalis TaxID=3395467 RepID=UPI0039BDB720